MSRITGALDLRQCEFEYLFEARLNYARENGLRNLARLAAREPWKLDHFIPQNMRDDRAAIFTFQALGLIAEDTEPFADIICNFLSGDANDRRMPDRPL